LLRQWVTAMCMYLRPSYPGYPFSEQLGDAEINTRIHRFLAHGVYLNPGAIPTPLRERIDNTKVSLFAITFDNPCNLICSWRSRPPLGLAYSRSAPWGVSLPEDVARLKVAKGG
jgi:hypothetical protein